MAGRKLSKQRRLSSAEGLMNAKEHVRQSKQEVRKSSEEQVKIRQDIWNGAREYMPFNTSWVSMPWLCAAYRPIDVQEARAVFLAFDSDGSGDLDKEDLKAVLIACGMKFNTVSGVADTIFEVANTERISWDTFRLWLRRAHFCERKLNAAERIYFTCEDSQSSKTAFLVSVLVVSLIVFSICSFLFETLPELNDQKCEGCEPELASKQMKDIEIFIVAVFTIEYISRLVCFPYVHVYIDASFAAVERYRTFNAAETDLWTIIINKNTLTTFSKCWMFVTKPMNLVDLLAILPFYVEILLAEHGATLVILRILRLARLFRILKLKKYASGFDVFIMTVSESVPALSVLMFILSLLVIFFGALLYLFERGSWYRPTDECKIENVATGGFTLVTCAEAGFAKGAYLRPALSGLSHEQGPFASVFDAMWCVVVTMTTCGYGDLYPTTMTGRLVMVPCMFLGIMALALPINVLGNNFNIAYEKRKKKALQDREDVFDSTKIGLLVYARSFPKHDLVHEWINRELVNIEKARNMLHSSYLMSDTLVKMEKMEEDMMQLQTDMQTMMYMQHNTHALVSALSGRHPSTSSPTTSPTSFRAAVPPPIQTKTRSLDYDTAMTTASGVASRNPLAGNPQNGSDKPITRSTTAPGQPLSQVPPASGDAHRGFMQQQPTAVQGSEEPISPFTEKVKMVEKTSTFLI